MHEMHLQGLIEDNLHCDCPYEHVDQGLIFFASQVRISGWWHKLRDRHYEGLKFLRYWSQQHDDENKFFLIFFSCNLNYS